MSDSTEPLAPDAVIETVAEAADPAPPEPVADTSAPTGAEEPAEAPGAVFEAVAGEPVELVPEAPEPMPAEISDKIAPEQHAQTIGRVETWLAETRYFISTLEHEVTGDAGEIIAWLKARL